MASPQAATPQATPELEGSTGEVDPHAASDPPPHAPTRAVPTYAAVPLPELQAQYRWQRGADSATADLHWQPDGHHYRLRLWGEVPATAPAGARAGAMAPQWRSQGQLGPLGLEPERFVVARRGRDRQAANFAPLSGQVGFSGSGIAVAWQAGMQDSLTWVMQLAAIVRANPGLAEPDQRVVLQVVGAYGHVQVMELVSHGLQPRPGEDAGAPLLAALHFSNAPLESGVEGQASGAERRSGAAVVQVWLDPQRQYLPLSWQLGRITPKGLVSTQWQLQALQRLGAPQ